MKRVTPLSLFLTVRVPTLLALFWRRYIAREPILPSCLQIPATPELPSRKEPVSIILFRLDALGDVAMTTPLFRELKKVFPESRYTVVVQEAYRPLLVTNPYIDEVLSLPKTRPEWLPERAKRLLSAISFYRSRLRGRHFDFAISPRWDVDEHLATFLCLLTSADERVGYTSEASPEKQLLNRRFDAAFSICLGSGPLRHEVFRNLAIVKALGGKVSDSSLEIRLTERDRRKASQLLAQASPSAKLVAVGIGARSPGRRWALERYAQTLAQLSKEQNIQPIVVCSAEERAEAEKLASLLSGNAIIISGVPLRQTCAVLERCALLVGNDSGAAHLAAAMNCPTVVISRHPRDGDPNHPNSPLRFAPYGNCVRVLQPMKGREECELSCCRAEPHCIAGVSVEEVAGTAREFLRSVQPIARPAERSWPDQASRHLMHSHSTDAMRRALEALRSRPDSPSSPI